MDATVIKERIRLGEDTETEFQGVVHAGYGIDPHGMAKAICALANTAGGVVLLGVERDGTVTGIGTVVQADALMRQVSQVCENGVRPFIGCTLVNVAVMGGTVLVVQVPGFHPERPFRAGDVNYVRDGNRSRAADRGELIRLLESPDFHYDEQPVRGSSRADLDATAVATFLDRQYGPEARERADHYLAALKCVTPEGNPTVAGLLVFGTDPGSFLPDARISAVRVPGREPTLTMTDRSEITGPIMRQVDQAIEFLDIHLRSPSRVEGWDRIERPGPGAIPAEALREALINAVTHRDYRMTAQVRLLVFDDRVEITNPGGLLNRLTIESVRFGLTQRRNHRIADLVGRSIRRENIGFGIPEMIRRMQERGLREPSFSVEGGHFRVVLHATAPPP